MAVNTTAISATTTTAAKVAVRPQWIKGADDIVEAGTLKLFHTPGA